MGEGRGIGLKYSKFKNYTPYTCMYATLATWGFSLYFRDLGHCSEPVGNKRHQVCLLNNPLQEKKMIVSGAVSRGICTHYDVNALFDVCANLRNTK